MALTMNYSSSSAKVVLDSTVTLINQLDISIEVSNSKRHLELQNPNTAEQMFVFDKDIEKIAFRAKGQVSKQCCWIDVKYNKQNKVDRLVSDTWVSQIFIEYSIEGRSNTVIKV